MGDLYVDVRCDLCCGEGARPGEPWCTQCDGAGTRRHAAVTGHLVAHLAAQPDGGDALLRELLRADPDRAVRVVDGCRVARAWAPQGANRVRPPLGRPVTQRGPRDRGEDMAVYISPIEERGCPGAVRSWMYSHAGGWSQAADEEAARTASDASAVADGWVLAGVAP